MAQVRHSSKLSIYYFLNLLFPVSLRHGFSTRLALKTHVGKRPTGGPDSPRYTHTTIHHAPPTAHKTYGHTYTGIYTHTQTKTNDTTTDCTQIKMTF